MLIPNEKARQVQALLSEYDIFVEYYDGGRAITRRGDPERAVAHFGIPESKLHFLTKDYRLEEELGEALGATGLQPEKINLPYIPSEAMRQELWQRLEGLGGWRSLPPSRTTWRSTPPVRTRERPYRR